MRSNNITVIVTNYNIPLHLFIRCMDSIKQFGLSYIIIDDASTNKDVSEYYPESIILPKNVGTYKAFNEGLKLVPTKYIMRVDGDDYITGVPDISSNYDAYLNDIEGKVPRTVEQCITQPYAGFNGATVKTKVLRKMWYTGVKYMGDIINLARLLKNFKCKFNDTSLYVYDYGRPGSITSAPFSIRKNDIAHAKRIIEMERNLSGYAQIEITTKCNMKCFYCCIEDMGYKDMEFEIFKSIVDKYYLKTKFRLQGIGEPTLHKHFLELIDYIHSKNLGHEVDFITNGKNSISAEILSNVREVLFSVDDVHLNPEKETKCLDMSRNHILEVVKYRDEINPNLKIQILSVNYGQPLWEIKRFCDENKIKFFDKPLNNNEAFSHRYQTQVKTIGHKCLYVDNLQMNYYYLDGTEAPCCFIPDSNKAQSREAIKTQLSKGIIPSCCTGCNILRV